LYDELLKRFRRANNIQFFRRNNGSAATNPLTSLHSQKRRIGTENFGFQNFDPHIRLPHNFSMPLGLEAADTEEGEGIAGQSRAKT
jgi:hypothetical protein